MVAACATIFVTRKPRYASTVGQRPPLGPQSAVLDVELAFMVSCGCFLRMRGKRKRGMAMPWSEAPFSNERKELKRNDII